MAPPAGNKKGGNGAAPVVGDTRFQKVHNDPRFARLSSKKNKLQIDKRFAAVLKDDRFQSVQGKYDKYGRRIDKKENELKKFYRLNEDDDGEASSDDDDEGEEQDKAVAKPSKGKAKAKAKAQESSSDDDEDSDEEESDEAEVGDEKMTRLDYLNRMARGELASGSDTSDDSDDSDEDVYMEEDDDDEDKEDIPTGEETTRFAVMNCDWTRIRAVDLFALFQSFAPATGAVKDVTIYPSDFGLEKMKEEEQHGPRGLWEDKAKKEPEEGEAKPESDDDEAPDSKAEAENDDSDDEDTGKDGEGDGYDSEDPLGIKQTVTASESDGFDVEKLRKYELQKLKYYYAVVTCDSVKTAATIYENCDQLEYETSANLLDLRFIPDDMTFTNPPKESCKGVPETYKPSIFATQALQQTEVKLTWEEDDDRRLELLTRQAEWKDAHDDDFAAYLASENSSSEGEDDDDDEDDDGDTQAVATETGGGDTSRAERKKAAKLKKIKNRYRKMLLGSDAEDSDGSGSDGDEKAGNAGGSSDDDSADDKPEGMDSDSDDDGDAAATGDMEMSFTPGAGDILRAKKQKELEANETPFERYVREKKLEKNKKRHEKRALQKARAVEQKAVLKKGGKAAPEELQALRAAIDDSDGDGNDSDGADRNFDMKKIAHSEKAKKLKGKRKHKELKKLDAKKSGLQEGFAFDAADPRFGKLYEKGSQFQLDPTDPKFKKTEATQAIFQERRKRQSNPQQASTTSQQKPQDQQGEKKDAKHELNAMVENLKRKSAPAAKSKSKPFKKPKF